MTQKEKYWIWAYFFSRNQGNTTLNWVIHAKGKYFVSEVYESDLFFAV